MGLTKYKKHPKPGLLSWSSTLSSKNSYISCYHTIIHVRKHKRPHKTKVVTSLVISLVIIARSIFHEQRPAPICCFDQHTYNLDQHTHKILTNTNIILTNTHIILTNTYFFWPTHRWWVLQNSLSLNIFKVCQLLLP